MDKDARKQLAEAVETLRKNPGQYAKFRESLVNAKNDEERIEVMMNFVTSDKELSRLMPRSAAAGEQVAGTWTTIATVTITI